MKLIWSKRALGDLEQIGSFISVDSPERARKHLQLLIDRTKSLIRFPESGRVVPEFRNSKIREMIDGNYRMLFLKNHKASFYTDKESISSASYRCKI